MPRSKAWGYAAGWALALCAAVGASLVLQRGRWRVDDVSFIAQPAAQRVAARKWRSVQFSRPRAYRDPGLAFPVAMAFGPRGEPFVLNQKPPSVVGFPSGRTLALPPGFYSDIAAASDGTILVASPGTRQVVLLSPASGVVRSLTLAAAAVRLQPRGAQIVALDPVTRSLFAAYGPSGALDGWLTNDRATGDLFYAPMYASAIACFDAQAPDRGRGRGDGSLRAMNSCSSRRGLARLLTSTLATTAGTLYSFRPPAPIFQFALLGGMHSG
jgi:hypothetical protein